METSRGKYLVTTTIISFLRFVSNSVYVITDIANKEHRLWFNIHKTFLVVPMGRESRHHAAKEQIKNHEHLADLV